MSFSISQTLQQNSTDKLRIADNVSFKKPSRFEYQAKKPFKTCFR